MHGPSPAPPRAEIPLSNPTIPAHLPGSIPPAADSTKLPLATPLPDFDLRNHTIAITGGARGLGLTLATALLESGARVHCLDVLPAPSPDFTALTNLAHTHHTTLTYHPLDVRDPADVSRVFAAIAATNDNRIDGLIAAAGVLDEIPALDYTAPDFSRCLDINVLGVFLCAQAAARYMLPFKSGAICLVASMSARIANRGLAMAAYNASKAAVVQLGRSLAAEWGAEGVRVNCLSPGYITTVMVHRLFERFPERRREWSEQNMLGRLSTPEEFRGAGVFLMSKASSFMTGSELVIDGGHSAW